MPERQLRHLGDEAVGDRSVETLHDARAVDELLDSYDQSLRGWRKRKRGSFWEAVDAAHRAGKRGRGRAIVVIDDGFDLAYPALADQHLVWSQTESIPCKHGTAVALLIREVAPEAALYLYPVRGRGGEIAWGTVARALALSAQSNAMIVTVSLGMTYGTQTLANGTRVRAADMPLCRAARKAASAGKVVLAAIGGSRDVIYSPAIDDEVIGCGAPADEPLSCANDNDRVYIPDAFVDQPARALGATFETPLLSGFAALMDDPCSMRRLARTYCLGAQPGDAAGDGAPEPLAEEDSTYADWGLAQLEAGDIAGAEILLRTAWSMAPASAEAVANLGFVLLVRAEEGRENGAASADIEATLLEAKDCYAHAVMLAPHNERYRALLRIIDKLVADQAEVAALAALTTGG